MNTIKYDALETVITIGNSKTNIPIVGWGGYLDSLYTDTRTPGSKKPLECSRRKVHGALNIAGKTFPEYIAYRLIKDGIGFKVARSIWEAATDRKNYIECTIPKTAQEFMVYCHELGHVKSRQYEQSSGFIGGGVCENTLKNEVNAWIWGVRYFKRLGFEITEEILSDMRYAFSSYTKYADKRIVKESLNILELKTGISFECSNYVTGPYLNNYMKKQKKSEGREKHKSWKPWHDLKQKQLKKSWKNQK